jgi:hypothetical protein
MIGRQPAGRPMTEPRHTGPRQPGVGSPAFLLRRDTDTSGTGPGFCDLARRIEIRDGAWSCWRFDTSFVYVLCTAGVHFLVYRLAAFGIAICCLLLCGYRGSSHQASSSLFRDAASHSLFQDIARERHASLSLFHHHTVCRSSDQWISHYASRFIQPTREVLVIPSSRRYIYRGCTLYRLIRGGLCRACL